MRKLLPVAAFCTAFCGNAALAEPGGYDAPPPHFGQYERPRGYGYGYHYGQAHPGWGHRQHYYGSPAPQWHYYKPRRRGYYHW